MNTLHAIFDWLLVVSLRASALTLLVFVIQFVLQRHLSPRWRYALWLPVLIVLLAPVLPESRWSIGSVFQVKQQSVEVHSYPMVADVAPVSSPIIPQPVVSKPAPVDWRPIQLMTWALGASLSLLIGGVSFLRTLLRLRKSRQSVSDDLLSQIDAVSREVGLRHSPQVLVAPAIQSPAVTGLLRPTLLLPAGFERDFTVEEARLILQHELTHLKRHDLPLNTLLCVLMALHWFNPLLWLAFFKARADREAACDAQVLQDATAQRRSEYGHALLKVEAAFAPLRLSLGFVGMLQRGAALRARIRSIAQPSRTRPLAGLLVTLCITCMAFLGVTRAEKPATATNDDTPLIAIEVKTVHFLKDTTWNFGGRFKQLDPTDASKAGGQIEMLGEKDFRELQEQLQKLAGVEMGAYPRMVTQDGKEVIIRSVMNQPVAGGKDLNGKDLIANLPIGFVGKFTPKAMLDDKVTLNMEITDSNLLTHDAQPIAASLAYGNILELEPGVTVALYSWQAHGWKNGKPQSYRPAITFITTHVIDSKKGGLPADASKDFAIGHSSFLPGDSIRITQVQRSGGFMTVTAEYELASAEAASISLHITSTQDDGRTKTDPNQRKTITKGKGRVVLHHPDVREGMPHVSFYPSGGGSSFGGIYFGTQAEADASRKMRLSSAGAEIPLSSKLSQIILPRVAFKGATLEEAVAFLRTESRAHDTFTTDEKQKGVPILLRKDGAPAGGITVELTDIPLAEALRYITELAGYQFRVEPFAVVVQKAGAKLKVVSSVEARLKQTLPVTPKNAGLILPAVEFKGTSLVDAIAFIRTKSREIDPAGLGVDILLNPGDANLKAELTLSLKDVPVSEALYYIAELSSMQLTADARTFYLAPALPAAPEAGKRDAEKGADAAAGDSDATIAKLRRAKPQQYDFAKAMLGDVLRFLATEAGLHFVSLPDDDPTSSRLITFSIRAAPFQVLETICKANGLMLLLERDVWHARAADGSELVSRSYTVPATRIPAKILCEDLSALTNLPTKDPKENNGKPVASITADGDTLHVVATRQQHIWVSGYLEAVRSLSSRKKTEIAK